VPSLGDCRASSKSKHACTGSKTGKGLGAEIWVDLGLTPMARKKERKAERNKKRLVILGCQKADLTAHYVLRLLHCAEPEKLGECPRRGG